MAYLGHFPDFFLVDLDAQAGPVGQMGVSVPDSEYGGVDQIVEEIDARIVMYTNARFLDYGIYTGVIHVQGGGKGDPPAWLTSGWTMSTAPSRRILLKSHLE